MMLFTSCCVQKELNCSNVAGTYIGSTKGKKHFKRYYTLQLYCDSTFSLKHGYSNIDVGKWTITNNGFIILQCRQPDNLLLSALSFGNQFIYKFKIVGKKELLYVPDVHIKMMKRKE